MKFLGLRICCDESMSDLRQGHDRGVRGKAPRSRGTDTTPSGYIASQTPNGFRGATPAAGYRSLHLPPEHWRRQILKQICSKKEVGEPYMPPIPKVEMKQVKKMVSARIDEETHSILQRYATFIGAATHDHIISESSKLLLKRGCEFKEWLDKMNLGISPAHEARQHERVGPKTAAQLR